MPRNTISTAISGTNTALQYRGPTEYLPRSRASTTSGNNVPQSTLSAATSSSTLLSSRKISREKPLYAARLTTTGARSAYSTSELPMTTTRNARMKTPRVGSAANECTDVSTPERTRNVPSRLSEKAKMASNTVQLLNAPRLSVTASECIRAVPTSHGMKEAFSTGSQNHQPPQPSTV